MAAEKREREKLPTPDADFPDAGRSEKDAGKAPEKPHQEGDAANAAAPSPDEGKPASVPASAGESGQKRAGPIRAGGHVLTKKGWQPEEVVRRRRPGYKLVNGGWVRDRKSE